MGSVGSLQSPIFRPTEAERWIRCPRLWDLSRRWQPAGPWTPHISMGTAIHAGLAAVYQRATQEYGWAVLEASLTAAWQDNDTLTLPAALECLQKAYRAATGLQEEVLGDGGKVLAVEESLGMGPEEGTCDLVTSHSHHGVPGYLAITDWKFTLDCKPENVDARLERTERTWQLWHYAAQAEDRWGLPVKYIRLGMIVGRPKPLAKLWAHPVQPAVMAQWREDARVIWDAMLGPVYPRYDGCAPYGERYRCSYYDGCHRLGADESRFAALYQRVEGTNGEG